jgi:hypothetical protein
MGSVSPADVRVEGAVPQVVWPAAEILHEWWRDWHAIGWDSSIDIDTAPYRRWLCVGELPPSPFSCEVRVSGPLQHYA